MKPFDHQVLFFISLFLTFSSTHSKHIDSMSPHLPPRPFLEWQRLNLPSHASASPNHVLVPPVSSPASQTVHHSASSQAPTLSSQAAPASQAARQSVSIQPPTSSSQAVPSPKLIPSPQKVAPVLTLTAQLAISNPSSRPGSVPASNTLTIKEICDSTDYPDLCHASVTPPLNGKADPESVLEMAIKACIEQTKLTMHLLVKMAGAQGKSIVNDCTVSYNDALDNFRSALHALAARDTGTMNSMLSAAITDNGDCEDVFSGSKSALSIPAKKLRNMVSNCLVLVTLIH